MPSASARPAHANSLLGSRLARGRIAQRRFGSLILATLALGLAGADKSRAAGVRTELEVSAERDGNPARAPAGEAVAPEWITGAALSLIRSDRIDDRSGWVVHVTGTLRAHAVHRALNELAVQGGITYRIQPDVAYTAPWYEAAARLERSVRADSAIRNLTRLTAELGTGAHLTDLLSASASLRLTRALADHGSVFDQTERALSVSGAYSMGGQRLLYGRWTRAWGDQVFGATEDYVPGPTVKAGDDDPALGNERYAYRMQAITTSVDLGLSVPVKGFGRWELALRHSLATATGGASYGFNQLFLLWGYPLR